MSSSASRTDRSDWSGFVLIDKPVGPSSNATVQHVRRSLGIGGRRGVKAGHAGTLDPFASGLLLVMVGKATRLMPFIVGHNKRYLMEVAFGASSSTDDREGVLKLSSAPLPSRSALEDAVAYLVSSTEQIPPAVSAIHVDGERAYQRVRRGETFTVAPRKVQFITIDLISFDGKYAVLQVHGSSGAYMRALARDLGEIVGCPAHCHELRRTHVGEWCVDDAHDPSQVSLTHIVDAGELIRFPRILLSAQQVSDVTCGRRLSRPIDDPDESLDDRVALCDEHGSLVALARRSEDGLWLMPSPVLVDPSEAGKRGVSL